MIAGIRAADGFPAISNLEHPVMSDNKQESLSPNAASAPLLAPRSVPSPAMPPPGGNAVRPALPIQPPGEIGGPRGLEPTRFGDWEFKGRCSDF